MPGEQHPATTVWFSVFANPPEPGKELEQAYASLCSPDGRTPFQPVRLREIKKPIDWEYAKILAELSKPGDHNAEARLLGKSLFDTFFGGKIKEMLAVAKHGAAHGLLRLAIGASEELIDVPWELLHDDNDFLLLQDCSIIRVADQLPFAAASRPELKRVALVAVTPDFDATKHLGDLTAKLKQLHVDTIIRPDPDREDLENFLRDEAVDALYFLGHGRNGQILLRRGTGDSGWLDAGDFAKYLPDPRRPGPRQQPLKLIYFSSCETAQLRPEENVFSGVAQRLLLSRKVETVVAMQAKIRLDDAKLIAERFFETIVRSRDPEEAIDRARVQSSNHWTRSIPVIYTLFEGVRTQTKPDNGPASRKNLPAAVSEKLSRLLGAKAGDDICVSLPGFRMGLKYKDYYTIKDRLFKTIGGVFNYRGRTFAQGDIQAAKYVLELLTQFGGLDAVTIVDDAELPDCPATFVFGSVSNERVVPLQREYATNFRLDFDAEVWRVIDVHHSRAYPIPSPARYAATYNERDDWGIIEKAVIAGKCYFFITGLGDRATRGCAYYLSRHWEKILDEHAERAFGALLRFPGGFGEDDFRHCELIDRTNNEYGLPLPGS